MNKIVKVSIEINKQFIHWLNKLCCGEVRVGVGWECFPVRLNADWFPELLQRGVAACDRVGVEVVNAGDCGWEVGGSLEVNPSWGFCDDCRKANTTTIVARRRMRQATPAKTRFHCSSFKKSVSTGLPSSLVGKGHWIVSEGSVTPVYETRITCFWLVNVLDKITRVSVKFCSGGDPLSVSEMVYTATVPLRECCVTVRGYGLEGYNNYKRETIL